MGIFQRIGNALARFMYGRNGADHLGLSMIWAAIALNIVNIFIKSDVPYLIVSTAATVLTFWALFRMFSRNVEKRAQENQKFLEITGNMSRSAAQARNRFKNRKEYKYFRCPKCHSYLKLPRNVGEVTVTCGKCRHQFRKKA